jgi:hypothetical protein
LWPSLRFFLSGQANSAAMRALVFCVTNQNQVTCREKTHERAWHALHARFGVLRSMYAESKEKHTELGTVRKTKTHKHDSTLRHCGVSITLDEKPRKTQLCM